MMSRPATRLVPPAFRVLLSGVLVLGCLATRGRGQLSGVKDGAVTLPGAIEGRLYVPPGSGKTLRDVVVTLLKTGTRAATDAEGHFAFSGVPPGTYTLVATGEGFSMLFITDVVVRPRERLRLDPEEMPVVLREGEVHEMEPVIVNASKQVAALSRLEIRPPRTSPFATANVDLPRTADDAQPYYLFDRDAIERSGTVTLEDFMRSRVPMDLTKLRMTEYVRPGGIGLGTADNRSTINLSGFGAEQTLILVNGRRLPNMSFGGAQNSSHQPNVNGVPLAAVDRIELLPASASAIYGSGAIGGVVNIVLRDDYNGAEVTAGYENPFRGHAPIRQFSLTAGETLEGGRTHAMISLSYTESKPLKYADREDMLVALRDRAWRNDPGSAALSYASSPIGATPNITAAPVSRVVDGKTATVPGELFGPGTSDHTFVPVGYAGGGGLDPLRDNAGSYNLATADSAIGERGFYGRDFPLELEVKISSAYINLRRRFTPGLEVFAEFFHGENRSRNLSEQAVMVVDIPATAATNPFGVPIRVGAQFSAGVEPARQVTVEERLVLGMKFDLTRDWVGEADYAFGGSTVSSRTGILGTAPLATEVKFGRLDLLRDLQQYPLPLDDYRERTTRVDPSSLHTLSMRAAGPFGSVPGGEIRGSFGVGAERESLEKSTTRTLLLVPRPSGSQTTTVVPGMAQRDLYTYAELDVPLVSKQNAKPGIARLDLQLAGRINRFTMGHLGGNEGGKSHLGTHSLIGMRYRPVDNVMLRGSYGSAFQPPDFADLLARPPPLPVSPYSPTGWIPLTLRDPRRGGELTATGATGSLGGNPAVQPSRSRSTSFGVVLEPRFARGLRVSVDYVLVEWKDKIWTLLWDTIVDHEAELPGRVVRAPAEPGDPFGVGRIMFVDGRTMNIASSRSVNYNIAVDYVWSSKQTGRWELLAIGNSWQHYQLRIVPGAERVEQINGDVTSQQQPKFTASAGLHWSRDTWFAGWMTRFIGGYRIAPTYVLAQGSDRVSSQIFHDVYIGYAFPRHEGTRDRRQALAGVSIQAGVRNVFDRAPAFEAVGSSRFYSPYGDLRMGSYYLLLKKQF